MPASGLNFASVSKPSKVRSVVAVGRARALWRYFSDREASIAGKLFVLAAVVYVISPVDLIPDVPIVGWLDDMGVMGLAVAFMWRMVNKYRAPALVVPAADAPPTLV